MMDDLSAAETHSYAHSDKFRDRLGDRFGEHRGQVNLALAKSYSPICVSCVLLALVCASLVTLRAVGLHGMHVFAHVAALLFVDSACRREFLFSANTMATFVLFSITLNEGRCITNKYDSSQKFIAHSVLNVAWMGIGLCTVVADIRQTMQQKREAQLQASSMLQSAIQRTTIADHQFCGLIASVGLFSTHIYMEHIRESDLFTLLRIVNFYMLSFAWIYLFHARHMNTKQVFNCVPCFVQFGSVLFTSPYISCVTFLCHSSTFAYFYYHRTQGVFDARNSFIQFSGLHTQANDHDSDIDVTVEGFERKGQDSSWAAAGSALYTAPYSPSSEASHASHTEDLTHKPQQGGTHGGALGKSQMQVQVLNQTRSQARGGQQPSHREKGQEHRDAISDPDELKRMFEEAKQQYNQRRS